jgi:vancomycin resistance protein VanW
MHFINSLLSIRNKQRIKNFLRQVSYFKKGFLFKMGSVSEDKKYKCEVKKIRQPINSKESFNKVNNIIIAQKRINNLVLKPGDVFSFWHFVGFPSLKTGYLKSRVINNNAISEDVGGGICQLSGLVYYLALHSNLQIIERHNHSIDIYKEEERFTPLGSDATVYFGYKDLVFKNNQLINLQLKFEITENELIGIIYSEKEFQPFNVEFVTQIHTKEKHVTTIISKANYQYTSYNSVYNYKK